MKTHQDIQTAIEEARARILELNAEGAKITEDIMEFLKSNATDKEKRDYLLKVAPLQDSVAAKRRAIMLERERLEKQLASIS